MLANDPPPFYGCHRDPQCDFVFAFTNLQIEMWSDPSDCLRDSEFAYGDDGYMFEPTRSDDDTTGHVHRAGNSEEA